MTGQTPIKDPSLRAPPPFLMLAVLAFWGWQTGMWVLGAPMGLALESNRLLKTRFALSPVDFRRIWNFCCLLGFALAFYAFTSDEEIGGIGNLLHGSAVGRNAMVSGLRAATIVPRWIPIILFFLVVAQNFSEFEATPLSSISMFYRWRQRNSGGEFSEKYFNLAYPYLMVSLFSAGIHPNEGEEKYFVGICVLVAWALWPLRSRRFSGVVWTGVCLLAMVLALGGNLAVGQLGRLVQNYNSQWMARMVRQRADPTKAMTAIGEVGELQLSSAIAIRLSTVPGAAPPSYLREASYRSYHAQAWYAGGQQNGFQEILPTVPGGNQFELVPGQTNNRTVNIACYLEGWSTELGVPEGLLPLPSGCDRLENIPNLVVSLRKNRSGSVLAAGPGLIFFDARYGGFQTMDFPPDTNLDLSVPTNEWSAVTQAISEMKLSGGSDEEKELAVARFFSTKFSYTTWLGWNTNSTLRATPLGRFLLETRRGHCEYFATATVLMLRALGIPARYAVGYYVHEAVGEDHYVARERDAHAWCLAWNQANQSWQDFDTTPGSWVATENKRASALQAVGDWFSWLHFQFSKFRYGQTHLRKYILWLVTPVLGFLLYQIIFRRGRRRLTGNTAKVKAETGRWPGLDSEFYALEKRLAEGGVPRAAGETMSSWLERVLTDHAKGEREVRLKVLLQLHYRHRFDPNGLTAEERKLFAQQAVALLAELPGK